MIHGDPTHTQTDTHTRAHIHTHAPQRHTEPFSLNGQSSQEWKRGSSWKKTGNRGDGRRKEKPEGQRSLLEEQAESDSLIVEELGRGLRVSLRGWCWTQVICMLPSLCMLFRWSGGWTVCGHLQLQDVLPASASCVVYFSGLFSRQPTWLVATGRVSLHDRVFVWKTYSFFKVVELLFFFLHQWLCSLFISASTSFPLSH